MGGQDRNNQDVIVWSLHNGLNQQWDVVYTDQPEPPVNFIPNKPFVLINQMAGKRLLTLSGANFVVQSRNNSPDSIQQQRQSRCSQINFTRWPCHTLASLEILLLTRLMELGTNTSLLMENTSGMKEALFLM